MSEKLKPCPFCCSPNVHLYDRSDRHELKSVSCMHCGVDVDFYVDSTSEAAQLWNNRVPQEASRIVDAALERLCRRKGFTLPELLVVIAVISMTFALGGLAMGADAVTLRLREAADESSAITLRADAGSGRITVEGEQNEDGE